MHRYLVAKEPGSFGGVNNLQLYSTKPRNEVTQWLMGQDAYTLHKPVRKKIPTQAYIFKGNK